jgi:hypothetical protein
MSRFSITVIEANTWRPSGTWAMPRCARSAGGTASRSRPLYLISPASDVTVPEMALNSVLLPAPFGPTTATNWPRSTSSETSLNARKPP